MTGWSIGETHDPDDCQTVLRAPDGATVSGLLFLRVPDAKCMKNRIHFDLSPGDSTRDAEVERLLALGATRVADHIEPDGQGWVVLSDPEGNEFCVERSPAEQHVTS